MKKTKKNHNYLLNDAPWNLKFVKYSVKIFIIIIIIIVILVCYKFYKLLKKNHWTLNKFHISWCIIQKIIVI